MSLTWQQEKLLYAIEKRLRLTSPWVSTNTAIGFLAKIFYRHTRSQCTPCILPLLYLTPETHMSTFLLFVCIPIFIIALTLLLFRHFDSFVLLLVQRTTLNFDLPRIFLLYDYRRSFKLPAMSNILFLLVRYSPFPTIQIVLQR